MKESDVMYTDNKKNGRLAAVLLIAVLFACVALPVGAQDAASPDLTIADDTLSVETDQAPAVDSAALAYQPEWYVAPVIPEAKRAPKRATMAANCPTDSVQTYNVDSVLVEVASYDYDDAGNVIRSIKWACEPDGKRIGTFKEEYGFDAKGTQVMTAVYAWDNTANDWRGTEKSEFVYDNEERIVSNTEYTWLNNAWVPQTKYTYTYDSEGRETEFYTYQRDVNTNQLVYSKAHIQNWNEAGKKILDMQYTAYSNGDWSAGTKKEWVFDALGNQTEYVYYASIANHNWVGSARELWEYNAAGKKTLYTKYSWANSAWVGVSKEEWQYVGSTLMLNAKYVWSNGAWVGSSKETWTYASANMKHNTFIWLNSDWANVEQEEWEYTSGKQTLYIKSSWTDNAWLGVSKEVWAYTSGKQTLRETYTGVNNAWVGTAKEVWGFNASGLQTLHEDYTWTNDAWAISSRVVADFDAAGNQILDEQYAIESGVFTGIKKEEYTFNAAKQKIIIIISEWDGNEWVYSTKTEADYQSDNQILDAKYIWQNGTWVGDGNRTEIVYVDGVVYLVMSYAWDNSSADWGYAARRAYEYDDAGRLIGDTTQHYVNSTWVNYSLSTHGYDDRGHDTLAIVADWDGAGWNVIYTSTATYRYNALGKLLLIERYEGKPGELKGVQKVEYTYDASGHQILYMQYEWKNGTWGNKSRSEQKYDEAGNQILSQSFNWSKNAWVGTNKYEYAYDSAGRQTMQARYTWNTRNNNWKGANRNDTEYDALGNISASISYSWSSSGNKWVASTRESFVRDDQSRVIEFLTCVWMGTDWGNNSMSAFEYDSRGQVISTHNYWWNNGEWVLYYLEDRVYDLADNKLRRETIGSWNNGELESYVDKHFFYNCDIHYFIICFANYDGTLLTSNEVEQGTLPVYTGDTPVKPADAQYTYTFAGWDKAIVPADGHTTYVATFSSTKNKYTITWLNEDGSQIDQTMVEYGAIPTHADPTKANTAEYTYTFAGWDKTPVAVTGDATYKATFNSAKNKYLITFQNEDGSVIEAKEYEYGAMPVAPADPTKEATAQYTYNFSGWDNTIVAVTGAATYKATFTSTLNKYLITFQNEDGSVIEAKEYEYGATPVAPADPTKQATAQYTYTFSGWDNTIVAVTGEATYKATFEATVNSYIITWVDEDGVTVLYEGEFAYGSMPEYGGADPVKEATAEYTYSFAGWTPEVVEVVGTATYTATYTATLFTGVNNAANNRAAVKVVENGIVYIVRAGKKYAITGVAVE